MSTEERILRVSKALRGIVYVFGPALSMAGYGMQLVEPPIEVVAAQDVALPEGMADYVDVWRDREAYRRRGLLRLGGAELPILSLEDTIVYVLARRRLPRYVEAIPALVALDPSRPDYEYLLRRSVEYGVARIVGALLDIAHYLNPDRRILEGLRGFRRLPRGGWIEVFPRPPGGRFPRPEAETTGLEGIEHYWRVRLGTPLSSYENLYLAYSGRWRERINPAAWVI